MRRKPIVRIVALNSGLPTDFDVTYSGIKSILKKVQFKTFLYCCTHWDSVRLTTHDAIHCRTIYTPPLLYTLYIPLLYDFTHLTSTVACIFYVT